MTLAWHTTFSCWPFPRLWLLAPASWIFARPSLPEAPARARRPAGERRRAEGNEPAPQKRRPPGNKRTTKTKIEREPRAIYERRRRFCSPCGRAIFWFVCCDGYVSRRPGGRSLPRACKVFCMLEACLARSLDLLRAPAVRPRRSKAPSRAHHLQENVAGRSRRTRTPEATSKRRRGRARAPIVRETPSLVLTS